MCARIALDANAELARLRAIVAKLPTFTPTDDADGPACSRCHRHVNAEDTEWLDGDLCHQCCADVMSELREAAKETK